MVYNPNPAIEHIAATLHKRGIPGNIIMIRTPKGWTLMVVRDENIDRQLLDGAHLIAGTSMPQAKLSAAIKELGGLFDIVTNDE
jgi:hypothetical protein